MAAAIDDEALGQLVGAAGVGEFAGIFSRARWGRSGDGPWTNSSLSETTSS